MSEASTLTRRKSGPKLSEGQRRAIVAEVATGRRQKDVAQQFGVHPHTVQSLVQSVREIPNNPLNSGWRQELYEKIVPESVSAIRRSVNDTNDIHKAAGTAMAHLKAVGVVKEDSAVQVNIFTNVQDLPADWRDKFITIESTDTPTE